MKIQVLKNESYSDVSNLPKKGTLRSTGYDIVATSDPEIVGVLSEGSTSLYESIDYIQYKTNLRMAVQKDHQTNGELGFVEIDYDIFAMPRSGVSKYNLVLANCIGLIDADYRGEVLVRFKYIWQPTDLIYVPTSDGNSSGISSRIVGKPNLEKIYNKGDKICQLKVTKVETVEFNLVDELDTTQRGEGGFGSTDDKKTSSVETASKHMNTIESLYKSLNSAPSISKRYSEIIKEREQQFI